jgi:hypothetical protein
MIAVAKTHIPNALVLNEKKDGTDYKQWQIGREKKRLPQKEMRIGVSCSSCGCEQHTALLVVALPADASN